MSQDKIFLEYESDSWFTRNKDVIVDDKRADHPLTLLELSGVKPKRVLEIGASNGWRLDLIEKRYGATCVGVEPSEKAVADGNARYEGRVKMVRGVASDIPLEEEFDLVIIHLVFHWVPREKLMKALSEVDRMVKDGGNLIVGDFDPDFATKTRYHHLPDEDIYTYKHDYASMFTATGLYREVARLTYDHKTHLIDPAAAANDRAFDTLLHKSLSDYYFLGDRGH